MKWSAEEALKHWQEEKLLTKKKADELRHSLDAAEHEVPNKALAVFSAIGAILVGLGVILFIASNWSAMSPLVKTTVLLLGIILSGGAGYYLAYEQGKYEKTGQALLLLNILLYGASIFLVAQIYHLQLNFWWGALLWLVGTKLMAYILQSRLHVWLSIPLLILFLGWLRTSVLSGSSSELDFLFDADYSIVRLFPVIGVGVLSLSFLHRDRTHWGFAADTLFSWGLFLSLFSIVLSTVDRDFFYRFFAFSSDFMALIIMGAAALLAVAAVMWGTFQTKEGRYGLIALLLYVLFVHVIAYVPHWLGLSADMYYYGAELPFMLTGLFVVHILLVAVLLLTVLWYGTLLRNAAVINLGMLGVALLIFIQYVSFGFSMRNRSVFFIVGGLLLIALSTLLERKRRDLLSQITRS